METGGAGDGTASESSTEGNDNEAAEVKTNTKEDTRIWVNEDLTKARATILWQARLLKKRRAISETWSFDGFIYVKSKQGHVERILSDIDLRKYNNGQ